MENQIMANNLPLPRVELVNEQPATTSLAIAECFGKNHKEVMRDIRNLLEQSPADFHERNFALMSRDVEIGNGAIRKSDYYTVYFDGFILLVMGYTGKRALQMKLAYIEAFNAMKAELEKLKKEPQGIDGSVFFQALKESAAQMAVLEGKMQSLERKMRKANFDQSSLPKAERAKREKRENPKELRYMRDEDGKLWFHATDVLALVGHQICRMWFCQIIPDYFRSKQDFDCSHECHALSVDGVRFYLCRKKSWRGALNWFNNEYLPSIA